MCIVKPPQVNPAEQIPDRQSARAPDGGDPSIRQADRSKRRFAMAASVFSKQDGTLGMPAVTGATAPTASKLGG